MGWPLNTVESLGSFSVGRYGAPLWLEGRLRLTAGQSGEAPDEVPGSCRSRGPAIGQLQTSVNGGSEAVCGRNELAPSWDQTEESARTLLPSEWRPRPATLASKRFAFARSTSSCQLVTSNESVAMPTLARNWMSAWHTATLPASRPVAGALRDGRFARPR